MIFYEAPHKLLATLKDLANAFGADRRVSLCRELTKLHEECFRTTLAQAVAHYTENAPRGEFVLVIAGCANDAIPSPQPDLLAEVGRRMEEGQPLMSAVKQVSREYNAPKNRLYQQALEKYGND